MRIEFIMLGATLVLAIVYIMAAAQARTKQYGSTWNMGARDDQMPPLKPVPARLARAQANLFETLPIFVGALLGAALAGHLGWKTALGAQLYFWGRLVYLPLYATGVPVVRTIVWMIAMLGVLFTLWALLFG